MNFLDDVFISGLSNMAMHISALCPFPVFDVCVWAGDSQIQVEGKNIHEMWALPFKKKESV